MTYTGRRRSTILTRSLAFANMKRGMMKSPIIKRSVVVNGHKTSITLEDAFWIELRLIAAERKIGLGKLITQVDAERRDNNLSSALRLFVLAKYRPEAVAAPPAASDRPSAAAEHDEAADQGGLAVTYAPRRPALKGRRPPALG